MIITLCGSTRFPDAHRMAEVHETLKGHVVIPLAMFGHADQPTGSRWATDDGAEGNPAKRLIDRVHFRKIDLCDEILVVNVGGYVGSSTKREIAYAESEGKNVRYLFPDKPGDKTVTA